MWLKPLKSYIGLIHFMYLYFRIILRIIGIRKFFLIQTVIYIIIYIYIGFHVKTWELWQFINKDIFINGWGPLYRDIGWYNEKFHSLTADPTGCLRITYWTCFDLKNKFPVHYYQHNTRKQWHVKSTASFLNDFFFYLRCIPLIP